LLCGAAWLCHLVVLLGASIGQSHLALLFVGHCFIAMSSGALLGAAIGWCHLALLFVGHCFFAMSSGSTAWHCHWVAMATATKSRWLGIALDFLKTDNRKIEKRTIYRRLQQHPHH